MTDLTSIGTLFAFVLVCGGVLILPRTQKVSGKFQIPYINGKYITLGLVALFVYLSRARIQDSCSNFKSESYQEILFLLFILIAIILAIFSFLRNYSLIPVLGVLCCFISDDCIFCKKLACFLWLDGFCLKHHFFTVGTEKASLPLKVPLSIPEESSFWYQIAKAR